MKSPVSSLPPMPNPLLVCLVLIVTLTGPANASPPTHHAQIQAVIETFRTAIIDKDRERFLALFVAGPITWQPVRGDDKLAELRRQEPNAAKVELTRERTPSSFIDGIVASRERLEETFGNARIDSDGDVAAVVFSYRFLRGGRETNRGLESWHLVRTELGWRIASVVWSSHLPPASEGT